jgi:hypothetical protein
LPNIALLVIIPLPLCWNMAASCTALGESKSFVLGQYRLMVQVGFVVDKVALGEVSLSVLQSFHPYNSVNAPYYLFTYHPRYITLATDITVNIRKKRQQGMQCVWLNHFHYRLTGRRWDARQSVQKRGTRTMAHKHLMADALT